MQVTKRTFLKGLLATAAAGGVVSQASAKPQADLPAKWDREALMLSFSVTAVQALLLPSRQRMPVQMLSSLKKRLRASGQHSCFLRRHDDSE